MTAYNIEILFSVFGNGDPSAGLAVLTEMAAHINHAREKHPHFADGPFQALGVMHQEYHEIEYAIEHETVERSLAETLDLAAVLVRFLNNEHGDKHGCNLLKIKKRMEEI